MNSAVPRLSVVVAIEGASANVRAILANLKPATYSDCEYAFYATRQADLAGLPGDLPNLRRAVSAPGARIPHMWRDGIASARATSVALLSAHVIPAPNWMDAVLAALPGADVAGVGGHFSNDPQARPLDWAIYLLRYAAFSRPRSGTVEHIAADNAVYRRDPILACHDLTERGFWEVEYHVRFIAQGLSLLLSDRLQVVHTNRYAARAFAAQRREHGFSFGRDRARRYSSWRLLLQLLASPAVPFVLAAKVLARSRAHGLLREAPLAALPWLAWFVLHWSWGETLGAGAELLRRASWLPRLPRRRPSR